MSDNICLEVAGTTEVTPELVARLFWEMSSAQQVEFFASLERLAGIDLCFQMAYVCSEMYDNPNPDAQKGFQTMLNHAKDYVEAGIDHRVWRAKRAIERDADMARKRIQESA